MTMELGGNAPFIVFDDSDVDQAANGLVTAKLRCSGQVCISPNRVYVQSSIHDRFVQRVKELVEEIPVDQGLRDRFIVSPLINQKAVSKVTEQVEDPRANGAKAVLGGHLHAKRRALLRSDHPHRSEG